MKPLHIFDWLPIFFYLFFLIWVGIINRKSKTLSENTFILSNRKLSLFSFIATLVTTWYGAILGIGENTYLYGIQTWFIFSFPYYIFATIYAFFIAPKIRASGLVSIPDHFHKHFGRQPGILSAILIIFLASPAPYILSMGILLKFLFHINLGFSLIIATAFSIFYLWNGGFSAVIRTDILQFICMFLGFFILISFLWIDISNPLKMINSLPQKYIDPLGGNTLQYVLVWFFIAAWTFIDPGFFQRSAAAKNPKVAKNGILIAILFWAIFDIMTITCGLYAINYLKTSSALLTYPLLAIDFLPIGFLGVFLMSIFAVLMSTIDSLSFISAITFGRDILWRINSNNKKKILVISYIKLGLVITSIISLLLAYYIPSVVGLLFTLGSLIIPSLILPFIISLTIKNFNLPEQFSIQWILIPLLLSFSWLLLSKTSYSFFGKVEPFYPAMISSILYYLSIVRVQVGN
mgnify:CR=1 FL=1